MQGEERLEGREVKRAGGGGKPGRSPRPSSASRRARRSRRPRQTTPPRPAQFRPRRSALLPLAKPLRRAAQHRATERFETRSEVRTACSAAIQQPYRGQHVPVQGHHGDRTAARPRVAAQGRRHVSVDRGAVDEDPPAPQ